MTGSLARAGDVPRRPTALREHRWLTRTHREGRHTKGHTCRTAHPHARGRSSSTARDGVRAGGSPAHARGRASSSVTRRRWVTGSPARRQPGRTVPRQGITRARGVPTPRQRSRRLRGAHPRAGRTGCVASLVGPSSGSPARSEDRASCEALVTLDGLTRALKGPSEQAPSPVDRRLTRAREGPRQRRRPSHRAGFTRAWDGPHHADTRSTRRGFAHTRRESHMESALGPQVVKLTRTCGRTRGRGPQENRLGGSPGGVGGGREHAGDASCEPRAHLRAGESLPRARSVGANFRLTRTRGGWPVTARDPLTTEGAHPRAEKPCGVRARG